MMTSSFSSQTSQAKDRPFGINLPFIIAIGVGLLLRVVAGFLWSFAGLAGLGMWGLTLGIAFLGTAWIYSLLQGERLWNMMLWGQGLGIVGAISMFVTAL